MGIAKTLMSPITGPAKAFSRGFDLPSEIGQRGLSALGGATPHVGGAAIGAGVGAATSFYNEDVGAAPAAAAGAAVGGLALPAIGLAGAGAYAAGSGILNNSDKIMSGAGKAGMGVARGAARAVQGPGFTGATPAGRAAASFGNSLLNPLQRYTGTARRAASNFADYTPRRQVYDQMKDKMVTKGGFKLKPLGWGMIGAGAVIGGIRNATEAHDRNRMGQRDGMISRATPTMPSYANHAGATGDLVFALNANRNG